MNVLIFPEGKLSEDDVKAQLADGVVATAQLAKAEDQ